VGSEREGGAVGADELPRDGEFKGWKLGYTLHGGGCGWKWEI
jgi:hypothetical protein